MVILMTKIWFLVGSGILAGGYPYEILTPHAGFLYGVFGWHIMEPMLNWTLYEIHLPLDKI